MREIVVFKTNKYGIGCNLINLTLILNNFIIPTNHWFSISWYFLLSYCIIQCHKKNRVWFWYFSSWLHYMGGGWPGPLGMVLRSNIPSVSSLLRGIAWASPPSATFPKIVPKSEQNIYIVQEFYNSLGMIGTYGLTSFYQNPYQIFTHEALLCSFLV